MRVGARLAGEEGFGGRGAREGCLQYIIGFLFVNQHLKGLNKALPVQGSEVHPVTLCPPPVPCADYSAQTIGPQATTNASVTKGKSNR